ncbi:LemA family protein [Halomonas aquamarina]|uniref:LemA family protein n=1 Tax=Vreelandella aquamarina TaxID=77097 RepID=A0ACC5VUC9_9GAMM|nr:LemA family protein [Halomonas aquamarina]MBZ5487748.1 LemA family protein [Halomonas aquamarina]
MEWAGVALFVALMGYFIYLYNSLVRYRQLSKEGWSGIDVQLKRRADLIPSLLETVKAYMRHERATLHAVTVARQAVLEAQDKGALVQRGEAEDQLSGALGRLLMVAEAYPNLKADTTFLEFQRALQTVENDIQYARRYYNGTVRNLNVAVESFPSNIVARSFRFEKAQYFELNNEGRSVPQVAFAQ